MERGAVAAVVSRARVATLPDAALAVPLLIAEDPLIALQALAAHVRRQWGKRVVADHRLGRQNHHQGSRLPPRSAQNSTCSSRRAISTTPSACPCSCCALSREHEYAVVEMGMNHAGEIAALARIAAPDWGVVTNVGTAHIENFADGQAGIARAKFELVAALPANGVAFLNCYDPYVSQFGRDFSGKVVYFGSGPCADPQILDVKEDPSGLHVRFRAGEHEADASTLQSARRAQRARMPSPASPSRSKRASNWMPPSPRSNHSPPATSAER